jgi:hypothetical protein
MDQIRTDCGARYWGAELPTDSATNNTYWTFFYKVEAVKIILLKILTFLKELYDDLCD